jgi:hypothetical protein
MTITAEPPNNMSTGPTQKTPPLYSLNPDLITELQYLPPELQYVLLRKLKATRDGIDLMDTLTMYKDYEEWLITHEGEEMLKPGPTNPN